MADGTEYMNLADMLELLKGGAKIQIDRPPQQIAGFDELIDQLKALVNAQTKQAAADLVRSKSQLEVLATLQAVINKQNVTKLHPPPDLKPLMSALLEIKQASGPRIPHDYEFTIERNHGLATRIHAKVVSQTRH